MNEYLRSANQTLSDAILETLSQEQHLRPHQALQTAIQRAGEAIGFCPGAAEQAVHRLHLDGQHAIGRLRRTELTQLAHTILRFWRQNLPGPVPADLHI